MIYFQTLSLNLRDSHDVWKVFVVEQLLVLRREHGAIFIIKNMKLFPFLHLFPSSFLFKHPVLSLLPNSVWFIPR